MPISSILPYRLKNEATCEWMVKVSTVKVLIPDTNALLQSMPLSAWLAILQFWRLVTPYGGVTYETRPGSQNDVCINRIWNFWGAHLCASMFYFWVGHLFWNRLGTWRQELFSSSFGSIFPTMWPRLLMICLLPIILQRRTFPKTPGRI